MLYEPRHVERFKILILDIALAGTRRKKSRPYSELFFFQNKNPLVIRGLVLNNNTRSYWLFPG